MNIVILYGGKSGEHEVSLVSASAVVRNMDRKHTLSLIGIGKDGRWFLQDKNETERIRSDSAANLRICRDSARSVTLVPGGGSAGGMMCGEGPVAADIVFPVLHGTYGEDGAVQGLLEMIGVPYVGCGVEDSAIVMDKETTKRLLHQSGIPVVPYTVLYRSGLSEQFLNETEKKFAYPLFVKPCCAGSSVGACRADSREGLEKALAEAFRWDSRALIEKSIDAREVECSVTGNTGLSDTVRAYIPGEIIPAHDFYDYDAKYTDPNGAELCIPARLDTEQTNSIRRMAVKAFTVLGCQGLARVDFFIDKKDGQVYLNELNTMPGFTPISMFPKMCSAGGLSYAGLLSLLIELGLERFKAHSSLTTDREE